MSFDVGQDASILSGSTTPDDLLLQLELMCAYIKDPGWRPEALDQARRNLGPMFDELAHRPDGPLQLTFLTQLHGGDPRFGLPPQPQLAAVEIADMRSWLDPQLASAPIELVIVGQVDAQAALAAAARTFGALPPRAAPQDVSARLGVTPATGLHQDATISTEVPQALLFVAVPTSDGRDPTLRRQLNLLGGVVRDRLRVEVREKLGTSYSPSAASQVSQVFPGVGFLIMQAISDPSQSDTVLQACLAVTDSLAKDGVTAEELERQKTPVLAQVRDQLRRNNFWLSVLSDSQSRPGALDEIRRLEADYQGVTAEQLTELAKKWLARERADWIVVKPEAAPAPAAAPADNPPPPAGG